MQAEKVMALWETMCTIGDEIRTLAAETFLTSDEDCRICSANGCQDHKDGCIGGIVEEMASMAESVCEQLRTEYSPVFPKKKYPRSLY